MRCTAPNKGRSRSIRATIDGKSYGLVNGCAVAVRREAPFLPAPAERREAEARWGGRRQTLAADNADLDWGDRVRPADGARGEGLKATGSAEAQCQPCHRGDGDDRRCTAKRNSDATKVGVRRLAAAGVARAAGNRRKLRKGNILVRVLETALWARPECVCTHHQPLFRYRDRIFQEIQTLAVGAWFLRPGERSQCDHVPACGRPPLANELSTSADTSNKMATRPLHCLQHLPCLRISDLFEVIHPKKARTIRDSQGGRTPLPAQPADRRARMRTKRDFAANEAALSHARSMR